MQDFYELWCVVALISVILMYIYSTIINIGKKYSNMKRAWFYYVFSFWCLEYDWVYSVEKQSIGYEIIFFFVFILLGMWLSWITIIYYIFKIFKNLRLPKRIKTCRKELRGKNLDKYTVQSLVSELNWYFWRDEFDFTLDELNKSIDIPYNKNMDIEKNSSKKVFISTIRNKFCLWINHIEWWGYTTAIYLYKEEWNDILIRLVEYCKVLLSKKWKSKKIYFVRWWKIDKSLVKQENYEADYFNEECILHKIDDKIIESYINRNSK